MKILVRLAVLILAAGMAVSAAGCAPLDWGKRSAYLRDQMRAILVLPTERIELAPVTHRRQSGEGYTIESITYASEPSSRVTALLYLPDGKEAVPAVIVACGHGGSKSCFYAQYAGQLYARLGFACLISDTIGEEERQVDGKMGARGHDLYHLGDKNPEFVRTKLKRLVLGKIVWDVVRGIDYLETRPEVDADRIGIVGYSLGGATAGSVAICDDRIKAAVICGWVFSGRYATDSKYCTRMPYAEFDRMMGFDEMTALLAPHAATLFMCGRNDDVIDSQENGAANVRDINANIAGARRILSDAGVRGTIEAELEPDASHRPYFLSHRAVRWLQEYLMPRHCRRPVPAGTVPFGQWVDAQGRQIEKLYNTEARERGLAVVDIGAVYRDPQELACFPGRRKPTPEYTMQGWVDVTVKANACRYRPAQPE